MADVLPEAYATVREVAKRVLGMRHFDVQLLGGTLLNGGCVAQVEGPSNSAPPPLMS